MHPDFYNEEHSWGDNKGKYLKYVAENLVTITLPKESKVQALKDVFNWYEKLSISKEWF